MVNDIFEGNPVNSDLLGYAKARDFGEIHMKVDNATGLVAIIAIHSTKLGPALGGCRLIEYDNSNDAIYDAMRLARGMTYKAAIAHLPLGGGKAVLMKPKEDVDRHAYFRAFAEFLNELNGRYITAIDSGSSLADMDIIHQYCPFVASTSEMDGEPSPYTADGVLLGIEAAVATHFHQKSLEGLHVAIQGVGKVGFELAKRLHERRVRLSVADVLPEEVDRCVVEFGATPVPVDQIHAVKCDIFSPCALGATLNEDTISKIKAPIVAGSANNQLAKPYHGALLHAKGILYAPDFVISAGGLIYAASQYQGDLNINANETINKIYTTLETIFARSRDQDKPTSDVAQNMALERLTQT